jgi:hypothetical protein
LHQISIMTGRLREYGVTVGYNSDPGILNVRPVLENISNATLVLNADVLGNGISMKSHVLTGVRPTKPSGRL